MTNVVHLFGAPAPEPVANSMDMVFVENILQDLKIDLSLLKPDDLVTATVCYCYDDIGSRTDYTEHVLKFKHMPEWLDIQLDMVRKHHEVEGCMAGEGMAAITIYNGKTWYSVDVEDLDCDHYELSARPFMEWIPPKEADNG
jgi:hypothetical protein